MQLPKRRHEKMKTYEEENEPVVLTPAGLRRLEQELERLETKDVKQAIEDVARTGAFGDRSENAEYQEARHRLSRTHARIFGLKERLKRVAIIQKPRSGAQTVRLGSVVLVRVGKQERTYEIVGPSESSPSHGRISHVSPLGVALIGKRVGDTGNISTPNGETSYHICEIK